MNRNTKYIVLYNPHDDSYKMFEYDEDKQSYAPNYGTPIAQGKTKEACLENGCNMWDIPIEDVVE